ncbi:MAG: hypothetical protein WBK96_11525 [Candidatus Manganitrophaceae bacterium]
MTFTDFLDRFTGNSGQVSEGFVNGTIAFSGTDVDCNGESFLEDGTLTVNVTGYDKEDETGDGTFEINESFTFTDLTMTITEAHTVAPACTPGVATLTLNGGMNSTDNVNGDDSFSATFTTFQMVLTPTTRNSVVGETLSLSGTIAITSSCANGTFTISTPVGQEPFVPDNSEDDCLTDGRFFVASGGTTTAVIFTSTGGVQIDEGNNGSVDASFADCDAAEVCT